MVISFFLPFYYKLYISFFRQRIILFWLPLSLLPSSFVPLQFDLLFFPFSFLTRSLSTFFASVSSNLLQQTHVSPSITVHTYASFIPSKVVLFFFFLFNSFAFSTLFSSPFNNNPALVIVHRYNLVPFVYSSSYLHTRSTLLCFFLFPFKFSFPLFILLLSCSSTSTVLLSSGPVFFFVFVLFLFFPSTTCLPLRFSYVAEFDRIIS
jgi:hypothetical protein